MGEKVYRKVGSRYKEIGETFTGFPADGVWLVTNGRRSSECIAQMSELPGIPAIAVRYRAALKDKILSKMNESLLKREKEGYHGYASIAVSPNDIAKMACDALAEILEKETV